MVRYVPGMVSIGGRLSSQKMAPELAPLRVVRLPIAVDGNPLSCSAQVQGRARGAHPTGHLSNSLLLHDDTPLQDQRPGLLPVLALETHSYVVKRLLTAVSYPLPQSPDGGQSCTAEQMGRAAAASQPTT